jgi:hypothetical protein
MSFTLVVAIIAVILATAPANAQEQGQSAGEIQNTLRRGDRIRVIDSSGGIVDGRVDGISESSLRLIHKKTALEVPEATISRIQRARHESDGILIGLGVGAAVGLGFVALQCSGSSERSDCHRAGSLVMIGPSAAAGALIDRAFRRFDTIFDRSTSSPGRLRISPLLGKRKQGIAITVVY